MQKKLARHLVEVVLIKDALDWREGREDGVKDFMWHCEEELLRLGYMDMNDSDDYIWNEKCEKEFGYLIEKYS